MDTIDDHEQVGSPEQLERFADFSIPDAEREALAHELFPANRKELLKLGADKDSQGRPVTIHRLVGSDELRKILTQGEVAYTDNDQIKALFLADPAKIQDFLDTELDAATPGLAELKSNLSYEAAMDFFYTELPRDQLAQLHKYSYYEDNITGLLSCSVGAPMIPPSDRRIAIEMVVPASELLIIADGGVKYEREVGLARIKKEWIVDAYPTPADFLRRFIQSPDYPVSAVTGPRVSAARRSRLREGIGIDGSSTIVSMLQDWTDSESITTLLPAVKVPELDPEHPIHNQPLLSRLG